MKHFDATRHQLLPNTMSLAIRHWPCSDNDILLLQDIFLTPGFHRISVESMAQGRNILEAMITALRCFKSAAVLTVEKLPLPPSIINIYAQLSAAQLFLDEEGLQQFFVGDFHADFVWIEESKDLIAMPWFASARQALMQCAEQVPVVSVFYISKQK